MPDLIRWDDDGRGFMILLKVVEKYSSLLSFRFIENSIRVRLVLYPKRYIKGYDDRIVFERILNANEFDEFIKALNKLESMIFSYEFSFAYELNKVISHLNWLRNYLKGDGNER
ncbi:MAG: hypothetical protein QXX09_04430 [Candidatus Methanomethylicia archaeon]